MTRRLPRWAGQIIFLRRDCASRGVADYIYGAFGADTCYAHIVHENIASVRYHEKYGFHRNMGAARFPRELVVNGMRQMEYVRTKEAWLSVREHTVRSLSEISKRTLLLR